MKITLSEWLEIERLKQQVLKALSDLEEKLSLLALAHRKPALPNPETKLFLEIAKKADEAASMLAMYDCAPSSEWMGGPTSGPGSENTKTYLREPYCCLPPRRYFTAAEVEEAKRLGLLKGGPDLTGPKN